MSSITLAPEEVAAIELLVGKFSLPPDRIQALLELSNGDHILTESALLVASEMGYDPFAGAHNYIVDILHLPDERLPQQTT
tara:strand:- start:322 stop:564 length:243 start_codon:yes stop_codon:yes gene_type:complete